MADYPDWTRLFQLAGTEITIPINIEASDVTLPVSIEASEVNLNVVIQGAVGVLNVSIRSSIATIDVNIESQDANITFEFADQSVAVFDAAKWFAHEAAQIFVNGFQTATQNTLTLIVSRAAPAGHTFYVNGLAYAMASASGAAVCMLALLKVAGSNVVWPGSYRGDTVIFDVPVRVTAGQTVEMWVAHYGTSAALLTYGSLWGYDEED